MPCSWANPSLRKSNIQRLDASRYLDRQSRSSEQPNLVMHDCKLLPFRLAAIGGGRAPSHHPPEPARCRWSLAEMLRLSIPRCTGLDALLITPDHSSKPPAAHLPSRPHAYILQLSMYLCPSLENRTVNEDSIYAFVAERDNCDQASFTTQSTRFDPRSENYRFCEHRERARPYTATISPELQISKRPEETRQSVKPFLSAAKTQHRTVRIGNTQTEVHEGTNFRREGRIPI